MNHVPRTLLCCVAELKEQSTTAFMERMTVQTSLGYFLMEPTIGTKTSTILTEWNHVDFTGRTLHSMAQSMFRYGEKALAYAHGFLDSSKKPSFGKRIDDLLNYILDEMHKEEAEAKKKMVIIYQKDSSVLVMTTTLDPLTLPAERSDDGVFIGYIDFCLYGCPILTDKDDRLVNFTTGACLQDTSCRNKTSSFESASFKSRGWLQELDLQAATLCIQSISAHQ